MFIAPPPGQAASPLTPGEYANVANGRFKRALTTQALGITWFGYNGASSSGCSGERGSVAARGASPATGSGFGGSLSGNQRDDREISAVREGLTLASNFAISQSKTALRMVTSTDSALASTIRAIVSAQDIINDELDRARCTAHKPVHLHMDEAAQDVGKGCR